MFLNAVKQYGGIISVIFNAMYVAGSMAASAQTEIAIRPHREYFTRHLTGKSLFWVLFITFVAIAGIAKAQQNPYDYITGHPKLIMTKYDELAVRFTLMEDPLAARLKAELKKDADKLLAAKDLKYAPNTFDEVSAEYLNRIITLSLAYRLFEDDKYSDKAIDQMLNACAFPDWHPTAFDELAVMTAAMAIGYDWNFYRMDLRQNETIRNKIVEYALNPALESYKDKDGKSDTWFKVNNHWNIVGASGFILGALAVGEDFPDLKNNIIYAAVRSLLPTLDFFDPDGVWYEGPASWVQSTDFLALAMSALNSSLGHDFGLSTRPGMDKTCLWYGALIGPTGQTFNFGESPATQMTTSAAMFWLANRHDDPSSALLGRSQLEKQLNGDLSHKKSPLFYLTLPWIVNLNTMATPLAPASVHEGTIDFMVFNGSGGVDDRLFLAAKGGNTIIGGQHLDAGSFVMDALGERWAMDSGITPDKTADTSKSDYWNIPDNNNLTHNTLVINGSLQAHEGECRLIDYSTSGAHPFGIFDLSPAYTQTIKAKRGFKMISDDQMLLRDEITFAENSDTVRWALMTDAIVLVQGKKATLTKNGKSFYIALVSDTDVEFASGSTGIPGRSLLTLRFINPAKVMEITVVMGKTPDGVENPEFTLPLDSWK